MVSQWITNRKNYCYNLQVYNSNDIFYQNNCFAPTGDEINLSDHQSNVSWDSMLKSPRL